LWKLFEGSDISSLIPTLGVFIAASFKMIPSINKIIIASQNIKFYRNSIDIIISELELKKNIVDTSISNNSSNSIAPKGDIEFKNVFFTYTGNKPYILENINFKIERGKSIGIIGESGAGKSTLIDLIVGLLNPSVGNIYIDGKKNSFIPELLKKQIGYISQNVFLFDASIADNITMTNLNYNEKEKELIYKSIENSDLTQMVQNLPEGIDTAVGENGINLSGGQKQRIAIARALYRNSKILILDEATSNLDTQTENKIIESINRLKGDITLIIISHRLSILEECDQIFEVKNCNLHNITN
jgi:ATP-binding cassette subfamily C protein